jgi:hypothetical protein
MPTAGAVRRETAAVLAANRVFFNPLSIVFYFAWLAFGVVVAVDAGKLPDQAFLQAGSKKNTWQVWPIVLAVFCCGIGTLVMGIIWFASKKRAVTAAAGGYPGYPPQGYGPPPGYPGAQAPPPPPPPGWTPPAPGPQAPPPPAPPPPQETPPSSAPPTWGTPPPPENPPQ